MDPPSLGIISPLVSTRSTVLQNVQIDSAMVRADHMSSVRVNGKGGAIDHPREHHVDLAAFASRIAREVRR